MSAARPIDALRHALRVQSEASARGFDWDDVDGVVAKVDEEAAEIREAIASGDAAHARRELGDLLLVCVNLARFLGADPAAELRAAADRFAARVEEATRLLAEAGESPRTCGLKRLDQAWIEGKTRLAARAREGA